MGGGEGREVTAEQAGPYGLRKDLGFDSEGGGSHGGCLSRGGMRSDSGVPRHPWATWRGKEWGGGVGGMSLFVPSPILLSYITRSFLTLLCEASRQELKSNSPERKTESQDG